MGNQKFYKLGFVLFLSIGLSAVIISCDKEDDQRPEVTNSIGSLIFTDTSFSKFGLAAVKSNLARTFNETGPFTLFAPDDSAFVRSGINESTITMLSPGQLQDIVLYHALRSATTIADLPAGPNAKVITASGDSVFVTKNSNGVFINGIKILQADIAADNGYMHTIDRVLTPPPGNTIETALVNTLDSLAKIITRIDTSADGDPVFIDSLRTATLTLFAPTDSAFIKWLVTLPANSIDEIPIATLVDLLRFHVVPGRIFLPDLAEGPLTMLSGGSTTINLSNGISAGPTITGAGNGSDFSNIITANILSRNGVVYLVDRVLIP